MKVKLALATLALLAACGTPQEQCIARETRDLRILDRLIAETEANIKRGYAIEEYTEDVSITGPCYYGGGRHGPGGVTPYGFCEREATVTKTRAKAIDIGLERQKLVSQQAKRQELVRAAAGPVATCKAQFPE